MSAYQPGIPTGLVNLDVDYQNLQNNFSQLDTTFGIDHTKVSNQTAQNGYHTNIHMIPNSTTATNPPNNSPPVQPTATGGYGQLWSAQLNDGIATDEALYFLTGGNRNMQLTRNFTPITNTNGATFLPGGLILQYGQVSNPGTSGQVTFIPAFPSGAPFVIEVSLQRSNASQTVTVDNGSGSNPAPTGSKFGYLCSSAGSTILYWMAIGK